MLPKNKQTNFPLNRNGIQAENAPWVFIFGFFLLHMLMFGGAGFALSYTNSAPAAFNIIFSGFAILIYLRFYIAIFGVDEIKWLIINSAIGILGIYSQLGWLLERIGKSVSDYTIYSHIIPGIYYVLYTFLLRRAVLHLLRAKKGTRKKIIVDVAYVMFSLAIYLWSFK